MANGPSEQYRTHLHYTDETPRKYKVSSDGWMLQACLHTHAPAFGHLHPISRRDALPRLAAPGPGELTLKRQRGKITQGSRCASEAGWYEGLDEAFEAEVETGRHPGQNAFLPERVKVTANALREVRGHDSKVLEGLLWTANTEHSVDDTSCNRQGGLERNFPVFERLGLPQLCHGLAKGLEGQVRLEQTSGFPAPIMSMQIRLKNLATSSGRVRVKRAKSRHESFFSVMTRTWYTQRRRTKEWSKVIRVTGSRAKK